MKSFLSTILLIAFLTFQLSEAVIFISFKINQDFIAKNLCVEKDVENSNCKGCCQLKKKLEDQKEKKEQLPPTQNSKLNIDLFAQEENLNQLFFQTTKKNKHHIMFFFRNFYSSGIFHPPRFTS